MQAPIPFRRWALGLIAVATLAGCQTAPERPSYEAANWQPPSVGEASPNESFWGETVQYALPVQYAQVEDARGNDWQIAYIDEYLGEQPREQAPTLVLVHGKGANMGYFSELMRDALQAGLRVVAFDIPYYGKSIPGNLDQPIARTLEDTRIAAHELLVEQLDIDQATYLGHSLGGQWVIGYALRYPEAVEKLVLEAPAGLEEYNKVLTLPSGEVPWFDPSYKHDFERWKEVWAPLGSLQGEYAKTAEDIRNFYYFRKKDPQTGEIVPAEQGYFKRESPDAAFLTRTRTEMIEGPQDEYDAYIRTYIRDIYSLGIETLKSDPQSLYKRLDEITAPVFLAFGTEEPFIPATALSGLTDLRTEIIKPAYRKLAQRGVDPVVKLYPDVGHFIHTDAAEQFNEDVVSFTYTGRVDGKTVNPLEFKDVAVQVPED